MIKKRGIYLLPTLFTLGNLAAGFVSILSSVNGVFKNAAWAIIIASIFDMIDGRIARMTKTTSQFGKEFDSLADIVSFGIAPSIMIYLMMLKTHKWGIIISFIFVMAGALRLARFNSKSDSEDCLTHFNGLPIPIAADIIAAFVIAYLQFPNKTMPVIIKWLPYVHRTIPVIMIILSYLMVSNIKYSSFKVLKLERRKPLQYLIFIFITIAIIWRYPENMIFVILSLYLLSGLIDLLQRLSRWRKIVNKKVNSRPKTED